MRKRQLVVVRATQFKTGTANLIVVTITVVAITVVAITVVVPTMVVAITVVLPTITGEPTGITAGTTDIGERVVEGFTVQDGVSEHYRGPYYR
jgi:hypothetical protein